MSEPEHETSGCRGRAGAKSVADQDTISCRTPGAGNLTDQGYQAHRLAGSQT